MSKKVILSNDHFDLFYHEEEKIIHHVFKEKLDSESFPKVLLAGTKILKENNATKWIADNRRQVKVLTDADNAWANNVWLPDIIEAGWKYWAIIVPDSMANRVDLVRYVDSFYDKGITVQVFVDDLAALEWIKNVDKD